MSNCDFYAVYSDLVTLLDFIFSSTDCRVFESYSEFDENLREFNSTAAVVQAFDVGYCESSGSRIGLSLYTPSARGKFRIEKIKLDQKRVKRHKFRYSIGGWGMMQLQLAGIHENEKQIIHSHLGHFSEKSAFKWAGDRGLYGDFFLWDWKAVNSMSRKIAYQIRTRQSDTKIQGRSILRGAATCLEHGYRLV